MRVDVERWPCPACHHAEHDPGSCPDCPRCELHVDEALIWLSRVAREDYDEFIEGIEREALAQAGAEREHLWADLRRENEMLRRMFREKVEEAEAEQERLDVAPHPGENHQFRTTCRRCGEYGSVNVAIITDNEFVRIEERVNER